MARIVLHRVMAVAELDDGRSVRFTLERASRLLTGGSMFWVHVDGKTYVLNALEDRDAVAETAALLRRLTGAAPAEEHIAIVDPGEKEPSPPASPATG